LTLDVENQCIYEFTIGGVSNWVLRLPNNTNGHEPHVLNWLFERFGPDDPYYWPKIFRHEVDKTSIWKRGAICTYVYQEYWFTKHEDAIETFLVFG